MINKHCDVHGCPDNANSTIQNSDKTTTYLCQKHWEMRRTKTVKEMEYVQIQPELSTGQNNGGANMFYKLPDWIHDVDTLAEYLELDGFEFNILKSLWRHKGQRHVGTSEEREVNKCLHYAQRSVDKVNRKKGDENEPREGIDVSRAPVGSSHRPGDFGTIND